MSGILDRPLTTAEIEAATVDGMVSGLVRVSLADLIDGDLDSVLDLVSEKLTGSILGINIHFDAAAVEEPDTLIVRVTLDPSMILDNADEDDEDDHPCGDGVGDPCLICHPTEGNEP